MAQLHPAPALALLLLGTKAQSHMKGAFTCRFSVAGQPGIYTVNCYLKEDGTVNKMALDKDFQVCGPKAQTIVGHEASPAQVAAIKAYVTANHKAGLVKEEKKAEGAK